MVEQIIIALLMLAAVSQAYMLYREQKTTAYWRSRWERSDEHLQTALRKVEESADRLDDCCERCSDMRFERDQLIASWPSDTSNECWQSYPIGTVVEDINGWYQVVKEDGLSGRHGTHCSAVRVAAGLDHEED